MTSNREHCIEFAMTEPSQVLAAKAVLAYEATRGGLTMGQAALRLLRAAVDEVAYPEEVREQLKALRESSRRRAAERALTDVGLPWGV